MSCHLAAASTSRLSVVVVVPIVGMYSGAQRYHKNISIFIIAGWCTLAAGWRFGRVARAQAARDRAEKKYNSDTVCGSLRATHCSRACLTHTRTQAGWNRRTEHIGTSAQRGDLVHISRTRARAHTRTHARSHTQNDIWKAGVAQRRATRCSRVPLPSHKVIPFHLCVCVHGYCYII